MSDAAYIREWRRAAKARCVESLGGKCCICGYNKCPAALEFHHLYDKDSKVSALFRDPSKWEIMCKELRKCVLLCSNCHKEVHWGGAEVPKSAPRFDEAYAEPIKRASTRLALPKNECPVCGNEKYVHQKTCSRTCAAKKSWSVEWDKVDLLLELETKTKSQIASELGVSEAAVRKRLKKLIGV